MNMYVHLYIYIILLTIHGVSTSTGRTHQNTHTHTHTHTHIHIHIRIHTHIHIHIHKHTPNIHTLKIFKVRVGAEKSTRRATGKHAREEERLKEKAREKEIQPISHLAWCQLETRGMAYTQETKREGSKHHPLALGGGVRRTHFSFWNYRI